MKKIDLAAIPLDDLWALHEKLSRFLSERMLAEKRQLEARLQVLGRVDKKLSAVERGSKSGKSQSRRRKYPKVLPKFQNPNAPFETWSGRGRHPRWLTSALQEGGKIEEFAIPRVERAGSAIKPLEPNGGD